MNTINPIVYQKYEEYSTQYIINLEHLNEYVKSITADKIEPLIDKWIDEHCYYILITHMVDDFTNKVNHNIQIAHKYDDKSYVEYLSHKLRLNIDLTTWEYKPKKIKIKIKTSAVEGYKIMEPLAQLLKLSITTVFKYPSEIIRHIHKYIYDHQLQNRYDRNVFTPDESLSSVLTPLKDTELEYTYDNLPLHINYIVPTH